MRVYIAGRFTGRARLASLAEDLKRIDPKVKVTSTWLTPRTEAEHKDYPYNDEDARKYATRDLDEIWDSDCLILDTIDDSSTGGREVEWGFALARGMRMVLVGPRRNVFHYLVERHYETWSELLLNWSGIYS